MAHLYMTDFGDVRVSEGEALRLRLAHEIEAAQREHKHRDFMRKARLLRADCERVAKWKLDHAR